MKLGLDVGSTTVKVVILDESVQTQGKPILLFSDYQRHHADIKASILRVLQDAAAGLAQKYGADFIARVKIQAALTGSAGLGIANTLGIDFVQEVIAETEAINKYLPETDVIIELGGEDAKITYLKPTPEQRMNGTCAGGTGAFIDQMATLLKTDAAGLNALAENYTKLYPIASRCGVFAKTDLQPLINDGAPAEDLAASIFQAVSTQTIAGLACGRPIKGNVVFLGGPLYFLPELRAAFQRALNDKVDSFSTPESAQLFVAVGAALLAGNQHLPSSDHTLKVNEQQLPTLSELIENLKAYNGNQNSTAKLMDPLFESDTDYHDFTERHEKDAVRFLPLEDATGAVFLGIDAGSTTIKAALIDSDANLRYSFYASNEGDPISRAVQIVREVRSRLPGSAIIARSYVTGYGEGLIKAALKVDAGEVETVAHYRAAKELAPDVSSIIDIGGQDMKFLSVKDDAIDSISVNEACSSGCGSFLQAFASTMNKSIEEFAELAVRSKKPVDLGSRCTVFMNSSVKQAQKEGADISDIAAGLSYSVVRNALYKVIKLRDVKELGEKVVVQGGTFLNDAVLRAFEKLTDLEVVRPNISGLMGAFGAALLAKDTYKPGAASKVLGVLELQNLKLETELMNCPFCPNKCNLTVTKFNDGTEFVSGNRCENGLNAPEWRRQKKEAKSAPDSNSSSIAEKPAKESATDKFNLYKYKYERTFDKKYYQPLTQERATEQGVKYRGKIGIPRALNMYENYPLWFTILTSLGFEVVLSGRSSHKLFEKGMDSIASENICYPAKLVHGHIQDLIDRKLDRIFYPCISFEQDMTPDADNNYNCPVVANYPQVIANNVEALRGNRKKAKYPKGSEYREHHKNPQIDFIYPYFSLHKPEHVKKRILEVFEKFAVTPEEANIAVDLGYREDAKFKQDILDKGLEIYETARKNNMQTIVLAGRPYHIDPEVNHGIPEAIASLNMAVISEDAAAGIYDTDPSVQRLKRPLRTVDQWSYHSRLYKAAEVAASKDAMQVVQLNSFGCGLDAVTTDQVAEILRAKGDIYTVLKIDEVSNLGAAKIRLRSLDAAVRQRCNDKSELMRIDQKITYGKEKVIFTKEMKKDYTILIPQMSPTHFDLVQAIFTRLNYNVDLLRIASNEDIECGLKYVNNDACYPAIIVIGQLINALQSGKYDVNKVAVIMSQTGGMCRATNYIAMLRMGLAAAGYANIPVISISTQGLEEHPGFKFGKLELLWAVRCLIIGDVLSDCLLRTRPYELTDGSANKLYQYWIDKLQKWVTGEEKLSFSKAVSRIVRDFDALPLKNIARKPKVGVVGEILVKYHPDANNHVIDVIEQEGCEAVLPGIINFMTNKLYVDKWNFKNIAKGSPSKLFFNKIARFAVEIFLRPVNKAFKKSNGKFAPWVDMRKIVSCAETVTSTGVQAGEGWLLAGEIVELIKSGTPNIVVANPFACLPNHVTGRGIFQEIRRQHPHANIVSIDYDPGASEVNQLNRIKLMVSAIR
ncbi:MAG: acyl-CoA dehydratase activase-related protein [Candidatus Ancillula sp.]|nr:acyl-CoA dehydratase activase-related protein [Candidatus Ancillula sp.]